MTLLYLGLGLLVVAQLIGIYALKTRKADLVFALTMGTLLVAAAIFGGLGAYHQLR